MSAERIAGAQRFLEVHTLTHLPAPERRHLQRFERRVGREGIAGKTRHREAAAAHADAVADGDAIQIERSDCEHELDVAAARCDCAHFADCLNDTGEHRIRDAG